MSDELLLSICITSYNRPMELQRCLSSIQTLSPNRIEVIVSEDNSPARSEIKRIVEEFAQKAQYVVRFNQNENNLGYDRNLGKLISLAAGEYLVLMSDDDLFTIDAIDVLLTVIDHCDFGVAYSPFYTDLDRTSLIRRDYGNEVRIMEAGKKSVAEHVYSSILFSGLVFKTSFVSNYSADDFKNLNYYQVYLFMNALYCCGGLYVYTPFVVCGNDGVNGYGISESSGGNELLADRSSIHSLPEFHKGLISVIRRFDSENNEDIESSFAKEYSLRLYPKLSQARRLGYESYELLWAQINELGIELRLTAYVYYALLKIFGSRACDLLFSIPAKIAMRSRGHDFHGA